MFSVSFLSPQTKTTNKSLLIFLLDNNSVARADICSSFWTPSKKKGICNLIFFVNKIIFFFYL